jgi:hypothetical protein
MQQMHFFWVLYLLQLTSKENDKKTANDLLYFYSHDAPAVAGFSFVWVLLFDEF